MSSLALVLARAWTFAIDGLDTRRVAVEVDIRPGLPAFTVVGLGDAAVREARERVHAAILNSGFEFPARRITANLAPSDLRKIGPGFDLALACALLAASGALALGRLERLALFGELGLGGELRPCRGTLAVAMAAQRAGLDGMLIGRARAREAALVEGLQVAAVRDLREAVAVLGGSAPLPAPRPVTPPREPAPGARAGPDLADVRGQRGAVEALAIAAAGGHNLLLSGAPGTGKTMLARRLPSILPPLTRAQAVEVTRIHALAGLHRGDRLITQRPFRAPHHSISVAGLVGGAQALRPGEASLAHHGTLFLDELCEFPRSSLEALRQPIEDGRVAIVRARHTALHPTRFMLVAATNPCPCGYCGEAERCGCSEADLARHRRRLSGPLLDRLDLFVHLHRPGAAEMAAPGVTSSARVRAAVERARACQRERGVECNAGMSPALVCRDVRLDAGGEELLRRAHEVHALSARAHQRILRVARTIADLEGSRRVRARHLSKALALRQDMAAFGRRAA